MTIFRFNFFGASLLANCILKYTSDVKFIHMKLMSGFLIITALLIAYFSVTVSNVFNKHKFGTNTDPLLIKESNP